MRLVDQFFRRWYFYLLPVVLLVGLGVRAASNVNEEFVSNGVLSASANPLVDAPEVRGTTINPYESPAAGTSRLINEQMRSDSFIRQIAVGAGLESALDSGVITPEIVREQVYASAQGENLLTVRAAWGDPQTAFRLVESTIAGYLNLVAETVAVDSEEATDFWTDIRVTAEERVTTAENDLAAYLRTLPPLGADEERTTEEELAITRLNSAVDAALADVSTAQERIDSAMLNGEQARSEAGRQLRIVDEPSEPTVPESNRVEQLLSLVMFTIIGLLIAGGALLATTLLDHSVRSPAQLRLASDVVSTSVVPRLRLRKPRDHEGQAA